MTEALSTPIKAINFHAKSETDIMRFKPLIEDISVTGPSAQKQYHFLNRFFTVVSKKRKIGEINEQDVIKLRTWFGDAMTTSQTLQGHVCLKPHGYDGDFVIIDKIYRNHLSENHVFRNWDLYFQSGDAPNAVRNRKRYFKKTLNGLPEGAKVLNLASGPCRGLLEYAKQSNKKLVVHNLDLDPHAVKFAKELLNAQNTLETHFLCENIFRFKPADKYDLIWSAGLFDYFDDRVFSTMLKRFSRYVKNHGRLIIGNFNQGVQSREYMEFGNWFLNYRTEPDLMQLSSFLAENERFVEKEKLNVNLFLNIKF